MLYVTANIPKSVDSRKRAMTREFRKSRKTRCLTGVSDVTCATHIWIAYPVVVEIRFFSHMLHCRVSFRALEHTVAAEDTAVDILEWFLELEHHTV